MKVRLLALAVSSSAGLALGACATFRQGPVGNPSVPEPAKTVDLDTSLIRPTQQPQRRDTGQSGQVPGLAPSTSPAR